MSRGSKVVTALWFLAVAAGGSALALRLSRGGDVVLVLLPMLAILALIGVLMVLVFRHMRREQSRWNERFGTSRRNGPYV